MPVIFLKMKGASNLPEIFAKQYYHTYFTTHTLHDSQQGQMFWILDKFKYRHIEDMINDKKLPISNRSELLNELSKDVIVEPCMANLLSGEGNHYFKPYSDSFDLQWAVWRLP